MTSAVANEHVRLVLRSGAGGADAPRRFNLHMLSPIILGFASPLLMIGLLDPAGLRHGRLVILALLVSILVLSTILFVLSILWPGDTTAVVFHSGTRKVEFIQSGLLANSSVEVNFDEIAAIGMVSRFDHDGYPYTQNEIRLRDGQRVPLPVDVAPSAIAGARRVLGL